MVISIIRYVYHYGLWAVVRRCFDRSYRPRGMGLGMLVRLGVHRVGTLWAIPTLKSWRVWKVLRGAKRVDVVLTLMWGGGAAAYIEGKIAKKSDGDFTLVAFPTYRPGLLMVELWNGGARVEKFPITSLAALYPLRGKCNKLVINHIIQWNFFLHDGEYRLDDYKTIAEDVVHLKAKLRAPAVFMVHDYFSICPRYTLTNADDEYCATEFSCTKCAACLATNERASLPFVPGLSISAWRNMFGRLLTACEEVRTFSEDTMERIEKIYPKARCTLVPHEPLGRLEHVSLSQKTRLVIGVVGQIHIRKGARHVLSLAHLLDKFGDKETQIVVIGSLDSRVREDSGRIRVLGEYKREYLPRLIEANGINLAWFPSIWPETFSYVTQELMQLGLPIVCYDIGAPKDRVRKYSKGLVAPEMNVESAWNAIRELARRQGIAVG